MNRLNGITLFCCCLVVSLPTHGLAREPARQGTGQRELCVAHYPSRHPYFGDTHVHTALSLDANLQGTRARPADAYRFAKGERIELQPFDAKGRGLRSLQLARPLDFTVVSDHAEFLGELRICQSPQLEGYDSLRCRLYRAWPNLAFMFLNSRIAEKQAEITRFGYCGPGGVRCLEAAKGPWEEIQAAAEAAYDRSSSCSFTSFVGYEWSASPGTENLHRNVIFRNAYVPKLPTSYFDAPYPEELWKSLHSDCLDAGTGCDVLTIPHNSNLSNGRMFEPFDRFGAPFTAEYISERHRFEPLVEIFQHKGDSECRMGLGVEDELCNFEKLPFNRLAGEHFFGLLAGEPKPRDFVRDALKQGLRYKQQFGVNPYEYGIIASTDTHIAAPGAVVESNFPGHGGAGHSARRAIPKGLTENIWYNPGGLAVVWAEENTREALFEGMRRRETYGTSGPRMTVRFFGGWDLPVQMCDSNSFAETGYARGVPMGSELTASGTTVSTSKQPRFAVWALRDPGAKGEPSIPLQRIQIVKGWFLDGKLFEKVIDVAGSVNARASVDPSTCHPVGEGADSLCAVWTDPDYDPAESAFYYARVLENPSCRWSSYQCVAHGVVCDGSKSVPQGFEDCCDENVPKTIQERAWTSPIWIYPPALE